jgi:mRNA-degrading endonuclease RelE of RelBE toxin-antitoxin system
VNYHLDLTKRSRKQLAELPLADRERVAMMLHQMQDDPYAGDIARLQGEPFGWRRRVGNYRVIYELIPEQRAIIVSRIERRTTTTYRKRRVCSDPNSRIVMSDLKPIRQSIAEFRVYIEKEAA